MLTRFGKNILLILLLMLALIVGIMMIDGLVPIVGTITY